MIDSWFNWLTRLSWDRPALAVFLALVSGLAVGGVGCGAVWWLIREMFL